MTQITVTIWRKAECYTFEVDAEQEKELLGNPGNFDLPKHLPGVDFHGIDEIHIDHPIEGEIF